MQDHLLLGSTSFHPAFEEVVNRTESRDFDKFNQPALNNAHN